MRPITVSLGAAGASPWVYVNELQNAFAIGLGVAVTSGANLTYSVQHSFDENRRPVSLTRTLTTVTVIDTDHRLSVGDSVVVTGTGFTGGDGTYDVASIVDANTYTYTSGTSGSATGSDNTFVTALRVYNHASLVGLTIRADGNYAFPVTYVRLKCTAWVSGKVDLTILQAIGR